MLRLKWFTGKVLLKLKVSLSFYPKLIAHNLQTLPIEIIYIS